MYVLHRSIDTLLLKNYDFDKTTDELDKSTDESDESDYDSDEFDEFDEKIPVDVKDQLANLNLIRQDIQKSSSNEKGQELTVFSFHIKKYDPLKAFMSGFLCSRIRHGRIDERRILMQQVFELCNFQLKHLSANSSTLSKSAFTKKAFLVDARSR